MNPQNSSKNQYQKFPVSSSDALTANNNGSHPPALGSGAEEGDCDPSDALRMPNATGSGSSPSTACRLMTTNQQTERTAENTRESKNNGANSSHIINLSLCSTALPDAAEQQAAAEQTFGLLTSMPTAAMNNNSDDSAEQQQRSTDQSASATTEKTTSSASNRYDKYPHLFYKSSDVESLFVLHEFVRCRMRFLVLCAIQLILGLVGLFVWSGAADHARYSLLLTLVSSGALCFDGFIAAWDSNISEGNLKAVGDAPSFAPAVDSSAEILQSRKFIAKVHEGIVIIVNIFHAVTIGFLVSAMQEGCSYVYLGNHDDIEGLANDEECPARFSQLYFYTTLVPLLIGQPRVLFVTLSNIVALIVAVSVVRPHNTSVAGQLILLAFGTIWTGFTAYLKYLCEAEYRRVFEVEQDVVRRTAQVEARNEALKHFVLGITPPHLRSRLTDPTKFVKADISDIAICVQLAVNNSVAFLQSDLPTKTASEIAIFLSLCAKECSEHGLHHIRSIGDAAICAANLFEKASSFSSPKTTTAANEEVFESLCESSPNRSFQTEDEQESMNDDDDGQDDVPILMKAFSAVRFATVAAKYHGPSGKMEIGAGVAWGPMMGMPMGSSCIRYDIFGPALTKAMKFCSSTVSALPETLCVDKRMCAYLGPAIVSGEPSNPEHPAAALHAEKNPPLSKSTQDDVVRNQEEDDQGVFIRDVTTDDDVLDELALRARTVQKEITKWAASGSSLSSSMSMARGSGRAQHGLGGPSSSQNDGDASVLSPSGNYYAIPTASISLDGQTSATQQEAESHLSQNPLSTSHNEDSEKMEFEFHDVNFVPKAAKQQQKQLSSGVSVSVAESDDTSQDGRGAEAGGASTASASGKRHVRIRHKTSSQLKPATDATMILHRERAANLAFLAGHKECRRQHKSEDDCVHKCGVIDPGAHHVDIDQHQHHGDRSNTDDREVEEVEVEEEEEEDLTVEHSCCHMLSKYIDPSTQRRLVYHLRCMHWETSILVEWMMAVLLALTTASAIEERATSLNHHPGFDGPMIAFIVLNLLCILLLGLIVYVQKRTKVNDVSVQLVTLSVFLIAIISNNLSRPSAVGDDAGFLVFIFSLVVMYLGASMHVTICAMIVYAVTYYIMAFAFRPKINGSSTLLALLQLAFVNAVFVHNRREIISFSEICTSKFNLSEVEAHEKIRRAVLSAMIPPPLQHRVSTQSLRMDSLTCNGCDQTVVLHIKLGDHLFSGHVSGSGTAGHSTSASPLPTPRGVLPMKTSASGSSHFLAPSGRQHSLSSTGDYVATAAGGSGSSGGRHHYSKGVAHLQRNAHHTLVEEASLVQLMVEDSIGRIEEAVGKCPNKTLCIVKVFGDTVLVAGPLLDDVKDKMAPVRAAEDAMHLMNTLLSSGHTYWDAKNNNEDQQRNDPMLLGFSAAIALEQSVNVLHHTEFPQYDIMGRAVNLASAVVAAMPSGSQHGQNIVMATERFMQLYQSEVSPERLKKSDATKDQRMNEGDAPPHMIEFGPGQSWSLRNLGKVRVFPVRLRQ